MQARSAQWLSWEREPQRPEGPGGLEAVLRLVHPSRRWPTFRCSCEPAGEVEIASRSSWGVVSASLRFVHLWAICWASLSGGGEATALGKA